MTKSFQKLTEYSVLLLIYHFEKVHYWNRVILGVCKLTLNIDKFITIKMVVHFIIFFRISSIDIWNVILNNLQEMSNATHFGYFQLFFTIFDHFTWFNNHPFASINLLPSFRIILQINVKKLIYIINLFFFTFNSGVIPNKRSCLGKPVILIIINLLLIGMSRYFNFALSKGVKITKFQYKNELIKN